MKTITAGAVVALMTASLGLVAVAPAMAQQAPAQNQSVQKGHGPDRGFRHDRGDQSGPGRRGGGGELGGILQFGRSAEAIEVALVRLSHQIEMTPEQTALFDAIKTASLDAQSDFATAVEAVLPKPAEAGATAERPSFTERLDMRIAVEGAHVAALTAVQPALTAFFDSLTPEQQAQLTPQRGERGGMAGQHGKGGMRHGAPQGQLPAPVAPPAPGTAPVQG